MAVLALAEAMWVLSGVYDRSAADVATAVDMLLNHKDLTPQDSNVVRAALALFRSRRRGSQTAVGSQIGAPTPRYI